MDWDKLKVFHAAAEAGSFTHAGERLGLSQSAVSRQVSALEGELGVSLFHRHARGLILTEQGELLYRTAHEVFMKLEAARTKLTDSRERPNGELKVSTTPGIGIHWLLPRLGEFLDLYPDIHITLITTDEELDLAMREADVAIRLRQPTQPDLIQRKLFSVHFHAYASPDYLKRFGTPRSHEELDKHRIILLERHRCRRISPTGAGWSEVEPRGQGPARAASSPSTTCSACCAPASAASASPCCRTIWWRKTAGWCSFSATTKRSRSTLSSSTRKNSNRWRAFRFSAISWSPTRSAGIFKSRAAKCCSGLAIRHGRHAARGVAGRAGVAHSRVTLLRRIRILPE